MAKVDFQGVSGRVYFPIPPDRPTAADFFAINSSGEYSWVGELNPMTGVLNGFKESHFVLGECCTGIPPDVITDNQSAPTGTLDKSIYRFCNHMLMPGLFSMFSI